MHDPFDNVPPGNREIANAPHGCGGDRVVNAGPVVHEFPSAPPDPTAGRFHFRARRSVGSVICGSVLLEPHGMAAAHAVAPAMRLPVRGGRRFAATGGLHV